LTSNQKGGLEIKSEFQDWIYGANSQWARGEKPATLNSRAEAEFRQQFPEDAQKYDALEQIRVYERPDQDPAISRLESAVLQKTNGDAELNEALSTGSNRFGETVSMVWDRAHTRAMLQAYDQFVQQYPEKAQAYADQNQRIKRALERQTAQNKRNAPLIVEPSSQQPVSEPISSQVEPEAQLQISSAPDPREYFRNTAFQKTAEQIDSNKGHAWQTARGEGFLVEDKAGTIALTETFDPEEPDETKRLGLLIVAKGTNGGESSIHIKGELDPKIRSQIADSVREVTSRLDGRLAQRFVRILVELAPTFEKQSEEVVTETTATLALKLLPDHPQAVELSELPQISGASSQQQEQLTRLIKLVSKKISVDTLTQKFAEFQNKVSRIDDAFGRNYPSLLTEIQQWALESREDTTKKHESLRRKEPVKYDIASQITRNFSSEAELEQILRDLPVEPMPDVHFAPRSRQQAELVSLGSVVGGNDMTDWRVSNSENRGVGKIMELSQALREGTADVAGNNQPIQVIEVSGKYFIEGDGRHRTAALKALGVKEVPMLVTHVKKSS
jgi:ParB-like chromosome segregation protein Spo0J